MLLTLCLQTGVTSVDATLPANADSEDTCAGSKEAQARLIARRQDRAAWRAEKIAAIKATIGKGYAASW